MALVAQVYLTVALQVLVEIFYYQLDLQKSEHLQHQYDPGHTVGLAL